MQLRNVGDRCVLDFSDIAQNAYYELKKYDPEMDHLDRRKVERIIGEMLDDHVTINMYWTKRRAEVVDSVYLRQLPAGIETHPSPYAFIDKIRTRLAILLLEAVNLPTWHNLDVRIDGVNVAIELGEDYRITDWMEKYAREYDVEGQKREW